MDFFSQCHLAVSNIKNTLSFSNLSVQEPRSTPSIREDLLLVCPRWKTPCLNKPRRLAAWHAWNQPMTDLLTWHFTTKRMVQWMAMLLNSPRYQIWKAKERSCQNKSVQVMCAFKVKLNFVYYVRILSIHNI